MAGGGFLPIFAVYAHGVPWGSEITIKAIAPLIPPFVMGLVAILLGTVFHGMALRLLRGLTD
jgi:hypothetical protein